MKSLRFLILLTATYCLLTTAGTAQAATSKIFEYAPDAWQSKRHPVVDGATPYLLFDAPSDFEMTGFDLWLDNPGAGGSITFTLRDSNDTVLAVRTAVLDALPSFPGGNKFHVNWLNPHALTGGSTYYLEISSSLEDLGLYYVDRISVVEHNRTPSTYALGAARLGSELQNFTFKFALYQNLSEGTNASIPEPAPTSTIPTEISISGARLVEATDVTALFAWSTSIASDSRVAIRTQLNPLYVVSSGYDATLELEHTILVTDLKPNINYFADVFSSDGDQLTLTTYAIGFKTLTKTAAAALNPPATPPTTTPVTTPPTQTTPFQTQQAQPQQSTQSQNQTTGQNAGQSNPIGVSIAPSARGGGSIDVSWNGSGTQEPQGGYRIDIFDYNYQLTRQIIVPATPTGGQAGTHEETIKDLPSGTNHAIVYANENGVFTKVAAAKDFTLTIGSGESIFNKIILISLAWIAGLGGWFYWKSKKKKATITA